MTSKRRVPIDPATLADLHRLQDAADLLTRTLGEESRFKIRQLVAQAYYQGAIDKMNEMQAADGN
jgi:hypothetical protein